MKRLLLLACAMPLVAMDNAVIPASSKLGALSVLNKNGRLDYSIGDRSVQRCDIYGPLKEISSEEQLDGFLANGGRINISKMSNGEYALRSKVDIKGGGPILAAITYWGVKTIGYSMPPFIVIVAAPPVIATVAGGAATAAAATATTTAASAGAASIITSVPTVLTGYSAAVETAAVAAAAVAAVL